MSLSSPGARLRSVLCGRVYTDGPRLPGKGRHSAQQALLRAAALSGSRELGAGTGLTTELFSAWRYVCVLGPKSLFSLFSFFTFYYGNSHITHTYTKGKKIILSTPASLISSISPPSSSSLPLIIWKQTPDIYHFIWKYDRILWKRHEEILFLLIEVKFINNEMHKVHYSYIYRLANFHFCMFFRISPEHFLPFKRFLLHR